MPTLQDRRHRGDIIQTFKAVKGINRVDADSWFDMKNPENMRPTRSNTTVSESGAIPKTHVMNVPTSRLDARKNFYNARIVKEWNGLPESLKNAKSTNEFKNLFDKHVSGKKP